MILKSALKWAFMQKKARKNIPGKIAPGLTLEKLKRQLE